MSYRADLLRSAHEYPRNCFADISVDHREFWRWYYRDELRSQDAAASLPVINPDVAAKGFCARIRNEISRQPSKFLRKILRHLHFPALVVGASSARHNSTTAGAERASELASQGRENLASRFETNATVRRA